MVSKVIALTLSCLLLSWEDRHIFNFSHSCRHQFTATCINAPTRTVYTTHWHTYTHVQTYTYVHLYNHILTCKCICIIHVILCVCMCTYLWDICVHVHQTQPCHLCIICLSMSTPSIYPLYLSICYLSTVYIMSTLDCLCTFSEARFWVSHACLGYPAYSYSYHNCFHEFYGNYPGRRLGALM